MSPDKQAVIFDWNGTIPDDVQLFCASTNKILVLLGCDPIPLDRYREVYDVPVNNMYAKLGCCEDKMNQYKHEMVEVWRDHYEANVDSVPLREGVVDMLESVKSLGHRTAILSNYVQDSISQQALKLGVHHYFDTILGRRHEDLKDVMHSKSKGERLHDYIKQNSIEQGIIVGDSPEEMEIARYFGFASVGVLDGCCCERRISAAKPDYTIHRLNEMPEIVRRVFGSGRGK